MISPRLSKALNPHRRRKLTLKQIRAGFGGKRRQASLKASKRHTHKKRAKAKASNPRPKRRASAKRRNATKPKIVYRTKYKTRTVTKKVYVKPKRRAKAKRRSSNPAYLMTMKPLGFGNPHKRRKTSMANHHKKRRVSAKGHSGKRRNPTRRRSVARRGHRHSRRSRNPMDSSLLKKGFGVFLGFSGVKKLTPLLGTTMNASPTMSLVSAGITAFILSWGTKKFIPGAIAEGVMWGAVGGVVNQAWNSFAPSAVTGFWPGVGAFGDFVGARQPWILPNQIVGTPGLIAAPGMTPTGQDVNMGAWQSAW